MKKLEKSLLIFTIIGFLMIIFAVAWTILEMMIDHNCYQLEPNEYYQSTVCEKYWKK